MKRGKKKISSGGMMELKQQIILIAYSTGEAYDLCQIHGCVQTGPDENGDLWSDNTVFLCEDEKVVGLCHCWPASVTMENGNLHKFKTDPRQWSDESIVSWFYAERQEGDVDIDHCRKVLTDAINLAISTAREKGW